jgi:aryl-alcohol dehydrogenase-like predicted oxidoreductase
MFYRELGKTGLMVSEIGFGGNRLGETSQPDDHWVRLIQQAVDLGVTLFDTSEQYAAGRSETMLGLALGNRPEVVIATKMSRRGADGETDLSAKRMRQTVEQSLRKLQRDQIEIYQLHSPRRAEMERFDWAEGMAQLQAEGKIGLRAVAVNSVEDGIWLIEQGLVEVLQITYNMFVTDPEAQLFALAAERGVGLMGRMPLARGVLTGKFSATAGIPANNRAHLDGERGLQRLALVDALRPLGAAYEGGLTRLAHHFCLTPPAMSAIIPGARTLDQLTENVAASNGAGLPTDLLAQLTQLRATWGAA